MPLVGGTPVYLLLGACGAWVPHPFALFAKCAGVAVPPIATVIPSWRGFSASLVLLFGDPDPPYDTGLCRFCPSSGSSPCRKRAPKAPLSNIFCRRKRPKFPELQRSRLPKSLRSNMCYIRERPFAPFQARRYPKFVPKHGWSARSIHQYFSGAMRALKYLGKHAGAC